MSSYVRVVEMEMILHRVHVISDSGYNGGIEMLTCWEVARRWMSRWSDLSLYGTLNGTHGTTERCRPRARSWIAADFPNDPTLDLAPFFFWWGWNWATVAFSDNFKTRPGR